MQLELLFLISDSTLAAYPLRWVFRIPPISTWGWIDGWFESKWEERKFRELRLTKLLRSNRSVQFNTGSWGYISITYRVVTTSAGWFDESDSKGARSDRIGWRQARDLEWNS